MVPIHKAAGGTIVKSLTYQADIQLVSDKDKDDYNQCVQWRAGLESYENDFDSYYKLKT